MPELIDTVNTGTCSRRIAVIHTKPPNAHWIAPSCSKAALQGSSGRNRPEGETKSRGEDLPQFWLVDATASKENRRQDGSGWLTKMTTQVFHVMETTSPLRVTSPSGPFPAADTPTLGSDWLPPVFSASDEISASVDTVDAGPTSGSAAAAMAELFSPDVGRKAGTRARVCELLQRRGWLGYCLLESGFQRILRVVYEDCSPSME